MIKYKPVAAQPVGSERQHKRFTLPAWLRNQLTPHSENLMQWVSYTMIVGAMAMFVLWQPDLPAWRFYGTLAVLSMLLVINTPLWAETTGICADDVPPAVTWLLFALSGGLVLFAFWLSGGGHPSFLPYLLFMLSGQATATVRFRFALLYSVLLLLGFVAILWIWNVSSSQIGNNIITITMGIVFVMLFTTVTVRYGEQTARAEALLVELRAANAELAAARERERKLAVAEERMRLARDIHDGLGHHLTVLNVQLQAAAKLIGNDPSLAAATIATCREVAQAALQEVRQSVAAMRRTPLDGQRADEAIRSLVSQFDQHAPLAARFELQGTPMPLAPAVAMTLYRSAQEGLTNVQKHAQAQCASVTLRFERSTVCLSVENDGPTDGRSGSGFGLAGLQERAAQLGGNLKAGPLPQSGFRLEITLPRKT